MSIVAHMATYPKRGGTLRNSVGSLLDQVDQVRVILNSYPVIPDWMKLSAKIQPVVPPEDLKDTGKFFPKVDPDDIVLLCDDDILYPVDYAVVMTAWLRHLAPLNAAIGLHGIVYSDFFDGDQAARMVLKFDAALPEPILVNQIGTGTTALFGRHMPPWDFIKSAQRFVDVRFGVYAKRHEVPLVCLPRQAGWLRSIDTGESIFENFTCAWGTEIVREVQEIGGFRQISLAAVRRLRALTVVEDR